MTTMTKYQLKGGITSCYLFLRSDSMKSDLWNIFCPWKAYAVRDKQILDKCSMTLIYRVSYENISLSIHTNEGTPKTPEGFVTPIKGIGVILPS